MPPFQLENPPDEKLENSPIQLVVWQLRFSEMPEFESLDRALEVHDKLGGREGDVPLIDNPQIGEISIQGGRGISPVVNQAHKNGWQFTSRDRATTATLTTTSLAVETKNYDRWDSFFSLVSAAVEAVSSVLKPVDDTRLGLRYIDRIDGAEISTISDWSNWLQPWTLGASSDTSLGPYVRVAETGVVFELADDVNAKARVALASENAEQVAVIDVDASRGDGNAARDFDKDGILAATEQLHTVAKQLFFASIKPELYEKLKGTTDDSDA